MSLKVFVIAGEASGDLLGASLVAALRDLRSDVQIRGVGGPAMAEEGVESLFPLQDLSVMGVAEVLPALPRILRRMSQTVSEILSFKPDVVVTIDSPDFCFRVARRMRAKAPGIRLVHYVAPSVWAWRPGRAKTVAGFLDHLLTLLPFEPPYFTRHGLGATFVGHPVVEKLGQRGDAARFRRAHGLKAAQPVLTLLPGSRVTEIDRLLGVFAGAAEIVLRARPDTAVVLPTLPNLRGRVESFFAGRGINPVIVDSAEEKFDAFAASTAAVAASGTVTLELALCDVPHLVAYRLGPVSALIARLFIRTRFVNLVNILLDRMAVPEYLLDACTAEAVGAAALRLLDDKTARTGQMTDFRAALIALGLGDPETPGQKAAKAVLACLDKKS